MKKIKLFRGLLMHGEIININKDVIKFLITQ